MWDAQELGASDGVWNPTTQAFTAITAPVNLFCSGPEPAAGRPDRVVGGHMDTHIGLADLTIFDPATKKWTVGPEHAVRPLVSGHGRPCPTGASSTVAGEMTCDECDATTPEIYNPATNTWSALTAPGAQFLFTYYPHMSCCRTGACWWRGRRRRRPSSQILDVNADLDGDRRPRGRRRRVGDVPAGQGHQDPASRSIRIIR